MFDNKNILVTGGTGSFGTEFVRTLIKKYKPKKIIVLNLNYTYKVYTLQELLKRSIFVYKEIYKNKFKNLKNIYLDEIKKFFNE